MNKDALLKQLYAVRANLEGLYATVDAALSILAADDECQHKNRQSLTVMGGPEHWICRDCGFEYQGEE